MVICMDQEDYFCQKCSRLITAKDVVFHGIRSGYSANHFPLFHFEKVPLCPDCLSRQKRMELFEKGLAVIALSIVLYYMAIGLIIIFSAGS